MARLEHGNLPPLLDFSGPLRLPPRNGPPPARLAESAMKRLRAILCVDDNRLVHRLEERLLLPFVKEGTRILHAYDGAEALRMLAEAGDVDLILLDINMPLLNGLAFLEQRQRTMYRDIPAVIFSQEGERPEEVAHALTLGAARVLPKPFTYTDLVETLEAIERDRQPDGTPS